MSLWGATDRDDPGELRQDSRAIFAKQEKDETSAMSELPAKDPLHGVKLESILIALVEYYGWAELGQLVEIRCFTTDPSVSSSLKFLRRTPWARTKVEKLYLHMLREKQRKGWID